MFYCYLFNCFGAVGFKKSAECTYQLIKPSLVFLDDKYLADAVEELYQSSQNGLNVPNGKQYVDYCYNSIKAQYKVFLEEGIFTAEKVTKFYATQVVLFFAQCIVLKDDIGNSAKAANSTVDYSVMVFAGEKYPDFISKAFRREPTTLKEEIDGFKTEKKIELCGKLRTIIPAPFTEYK